MTSFEIALSGDLRRADGSMAHPDFDLEPLRRAPNVRVRWVDAVEGVMPAAGLEDVDALILLGSRVTAASLPHSRRLAVVARFGVGYDSVDVAACTAHDVVLVTTPDGVRRPVAVAVLTLVLALASRLIEKDRLVREGPMGWSRRNGHMGVGLVGRTLGQLGMGNIGAEVFRIAAPLDPYADRALASELGVELVDLDTLCRESDFLSVSCPLSPATYHLVDAERLALM